ncbi:hypothetical protein [Pseudomonas farris]
MLFQDSQITDARPKRNQESEFAFLNRSSHPETARVRDFLESLIAEYPASERNELAGRIICGDDVHFKSATFELLLYAIFRRLGCDLEPHPELSNGSKKRPDFLVTTPDGTQFYLEAVLASESNSTDPAAEARKGAVFDAIASAVHPNFFVNLKQKGNPKTQPSVKALLRKLHHWLDSLDPDAVAKAFTEDGSDALPSYEWQHENWALTFKANPLKTEARGTGRTLLRALHSEAKYVDAWSPIRDAVTRKGSRYGDMGKPFLVAVNMGCFHLGRMDVMQALYGQETFSFSVAHPEQEPKFRRAPNGAWYGKHGPKYTRVSGLWIFNSLSPHTVAVRPQSIYFNPWASTPLPDFLRELPHATANGTQINWADGKSLRDIFGLPPTWPE